MANSGTLGGVGISRAGGTAGGSWFCTMGARLTVETLWCVGHPWKKSITQLLIINPKKRSRGMNRCLERHTLQVLIYLKWRCFSAAQVWQHCPAECTQWFSSTAHYCRCSGQPAQSQFEKWKRNRADREEKRQKVWRGTKAMHGQTLYLLQLFSEVFIHRLSESVDWHWSFWTCRREEWEVTKKYPP